MSIPFIGNVGFTEISSAGSLTSAASSRIALPIQLFKLTGSISGQLTLTENSNHKKVIIDTNGNNIINSSGSPLNVDCPSGVAVELKGSGNVQSTLKTFTSAVSSTSNTGTTTISDAGNSTLAVTTNHTFTEQLLNTVRTAPGSTGTGGGAPFSDSTTTVKRPQDSSNSTRKVNGTYYTTSFATTFGGFGLDNINRSDFGMSFTHAFVEDGTVVSGAIVGPSGASTFNGVSADQPDTNTTHTVGSDTYRYMQWNSALVGVNNGNTGTMGIAMYIDVNTGKAVVEIILGSGGRAAFNQIKNVDVFTTSTGRKFTFTNNTSHTITLSGGDPYPSTSVSASGTGVVNRDSTDGSFSITGTFPSTNDAGAPLSSVGLNETSSTSVNVDNHTGTNSVKAF